ncbi:hypothetical protein VCHA50P417_20497 [Vibrio chagasii]|nr:hypothetical protein VCHA50P417_20497 [Vibrio chagasii]
MVRNESLAQVLQVFENDLLKKIQNRLPARVLSVSDDRKTVTVKPLISMVDENNNILERGDIEGLRVFKYGAGGFFLSFDVRENDLGWIDACDRDVSLFLQSYRESPPNTLRKHSFSDAQFIPDIMTNFVIDDEDAGCLVIQNRDSTVKISMGSERINIKAPELNLTADSIGLIANELTIAAELIDVAGDEISIDGQVSISGGSCEVSSDSFVVSSPSASINGIAFTPNGDVVSDSGISLIDHYHSQDPSLPADGHTHAQQDTGAAQ